MSLTKRSKGFTLIELMIVVAIIGILAAVAIPKFADLVTKSKEAAVKGSLGAVRSAVSIYYGDTEGTYPTNLFVGLTTGGRYMPAISGLASLGMIDIPKTKTGNPGHLYGSVNDPRLVKEGDATDANDATPFYFVNGAVTTTRNGELFINCSHNDTKGNIWSGF